MDQLLLNQVLQNETPCIVSTVLWINLNIVRDYCVSYMYINTYIYSKHMTWWVFGVCKDRRGQGLFGHGKCGVEEAVSKQEGKNNRYLTKLVLPLTNM